MAKSQFQCIARPTDCCSNGDVSDENVSHVGKAVVDILKLRHTLEENMAAASTEEERQNIADQVETAAVTAIGDQGLTVADTIRSSHRREMMPNWRSRSSSPAAPLDAFRQAPRGAIQGECDRPFRKLPQWRP